MAKIGRDMGEMTEVDVTQEGIGELWGLLVSLLDVGYSTPRLRIARIPGVDEDSVREALRLEADRAAAEKAEKEAQQKDALEKLRAEYQSLTTAPDALYAAEQNGQWVRCARASSQLTVSLDAGLRVGIPCHGYTSPEQDGVIAEFASKIEKMGAEVEAHNDAEFTRLLPGALAEREKSEAEKEKSEAEAEAQRQKKISERAAKRLESGYWERKTESYNERRYSSPWCAAVTFPSGPKAVYSFGDATGKWGKEGLLRVACRPGDIIAWGQKDLRRPGNSEHNLLVMLDNGRMKTVEKTEAFRLWQEKAGA